MKGDVGAGNICEQRSSCLTFSGLHGLPQGNHESSSGRPAVLWRNSPGICGKSQDTFKIRSGVTFKEAWLPESRDWAWVCLWLPKSLAVYRLVFDVANSVCVYSPEPCREREN